MTTSKPDNRRRLFTIEARAQHSPIAPEDRAWLRATYPKKAARLEGAGVDMPECDYATLASVGSLEKPVVVADLTALARRVHRLRRDAPIQCENALLELSDAEPKPIVNVYSLDDTGAKVSLLCHAFLRGLKAGALMSALERVQPQPALTMRVRTL